MKSYICTAPKTFYFLKQRLDSPSPLRSLSRSPEKKTVFLLLENRTFFECVKYIL